MEINDYQNNAMTYRMKTANATYALLNLAGEAGEVLSLAAKFIRDGHMFPEQFKEALCKELGDVMWMVAAIANDNNLKLSDVCQMNLDKLEDRKQRNVITGSGDNR